MQGRYASLEGQRSVSAAPAVERRMAGGGRPPPQKIFQIQKLPGSPGFYQPGGRLGRGARSPSGYSARLGKGGHQAVDPQDRWFDRERLCLCSQGR
jgi:hypothetical protein